MDKILFKSLFGQNNELTGNGTILLIGTKQGEILYLQIPEEKTSNPIIKEIEISKISQPILKFLFSSLKKDDENNLLIIIGCFGKIIIIRSNNLIDFSNSIFHSFDIQTNIQDAYINEIGNLFYLSNGKVYFIDIIKKLNENSNSIADILIPYCSFKKKQNFLAIGKSNCKWIGISDGNLYEFPILSSSKVLANKKIQKEDENNQNEDEEKLFLTKTQQQNKMKENLSKLAILANSQKEIQLKQQKINQIVKEIGNLTNLFHKNEINKIFTCSIEYYHYNSHEIKTNSKSFIIKLNYLGKIQIQNSNFLINHWKILIEFSSLKFSSSITLSLPFIWTEMGKSFSFIIQNPCDSFLLIYPLDVTIYLLFYPDEINSISQFISIPICSHHFSSLDFQSLIHDHGNNTLFFHPYNNIQPHSYLHSSKIINNNDNLMICKFVISSPISTSLNAMDLLQFMFHQELPNNFIDSIDKFSEFNIKSNSKSLSDFMNIQINPIYEPDCIPKLSISCECSSWIYFHFRVSFEYLILCLYYKLNDYFKDQIKKEIIKSNHLKQVHDDLIESIFSVNISNQHASLIHLSSEINEQIQSFSKNISNSTPFAKLLHIYFELQQKLFTEYFTLRNQLNSLLI